MMRLPDTVPLRPLYSPMPLPSRGLPLSDLPRIFWTGKREFPLGNVTGAAEAFGKVLKPRQVSAGLVGSLKLPQMLKVAPVLNPLNCGWLKILNASRRNWMLRALSPPSGKFLNNERSVTLIPGVSMNPTGYCPWSFNASATLGNRTFCQLKALLRSDDLLISAVDRAPMPSVQDPAMR